MSARENPQWETPPPAPEPEGPFGGPWGASGSDQGFGPEGEAGASGGPGHQCLELCPICRGAEMLRAAGLAGGSGELRGQLDDVGREALLTLRALIDHYIERLDQRPSRTEVEEIPID